MPEELILKIFRQHLDEEFSSAINRLEERNDAFKFLDGSGVHTGFDDYSRRISQIATISQASARYVTRTVLPHNMATLAQRSSELREDFNASTPVHATMSPDSMKELRRVQRLILTRWVMKQAKRKLARGRWLLERVLDRESENDRRGVAWEDVWKSDEESDEDI